MQDNKKPWITSRSAGIACIALALVFVMAALVSEEEILLLPAALCVIYSMYISVSQDVILDQHLKQFKMEEQHAGNRPGQSKFVINFDKTKVLSYGCDDTSDSLYWLKLVDNNNGKTIIQRGFGDDILDGIDMITLIEMHLPAHIKNDATKLLEEHKLQMAAKLPF